ncbi:hypothetical protein ATANTOWER_002301 [Ataeniobius toweri]|uniref:Uncharacterized protein n=1 Tax=Ataeniobius toweri TaxID=208326 RepID=A0ABU7CHU1_9TELE|nr:hypothetical protein [Ataeniobius toweri]
MSKAGTFKDPELKLVLQDVVSGEELPRKVKQVLGLSVPSSSEEDSSGSQSSETERLLGQTEGGAASVHVPTYP